MKYSDLLFRSGFIVSGSVFYIDAYDPKVDDIDTPNYTLCRYDNESQDLACLDIGENIIDYVVIKEGKESVFGITEVGEYFVENEDGIDWGDIDLSDEGPNYLRHLTALCLIDRYIYAVGIRRMVYRYSVDKGVWERVDTGVKQNISEEGEVSGFYAIAGFSESELYVVGISGDVWKQADGNWRRLPTITNADLLDVMQLTDGTVVACGDNGTVILGFDEEWEVVPNDVEDGAFVSLATSGEIVYLVSDSQRLYVIDNGSVSLLDEFEGLGMKANDVSFRQGLLLVVGDKEVAVLEEEKWQKYVFKKEGEIE